MSIADLQQEGARNPDDPIVYTFSTSSPSRFTTFAAIFPPASTEAGTLVAL
jgi:hypothetical protein